MWWWQLGCKEGWTPQTTAKLGWSVKMRSMQDNDLDLALKLSNIIVKDGLSPLTKLSRFSNFDKNSSNSTV